MLQAHREQLIALEEPRERMPQLGTHGATRYRRPARRAELHDAETYIKLPENLQGFIARLADTANTVGHPRAPTRQAADRTSPGAPPQPARQPQQHLSPLGSFQIAGRFRLASGSDTQLI
jgi:hypothetical protein